MGRYQVRLVGVVDHREPEPIRQGVHQFSHSWRVDDCSVPFALVGLLQRGGLGRSGTKSKRRAKKSAAGSSIENSLSSTALRSSNSADSAAHACRKPE
jgi:hypothetical protein